MFLSWRFRRKRVKPECPPCHRRLSTISNARCHVSHQSCQRRRDCTTRAVHHEVARAKKLPLTPPPGLEPPMIAPPSAEHALTAADHVGSMETVKKRKTEDPLECGPTEESSEVANLASRVFATSRVLHGATITSSGHSHLSPITSGSSIRQQSRRHCTSRLCRTATRTTLSRDRIHGVHLVERSATRPVLLDIPSLKIFQD